MFKKLMVEAIRHAGTKKEIKDISKKFLPFKSKKNNGLPLNLKKKIKNIWIYILFFNWKKIEDTKTRLLKFEKFKDINFFF